MIFYKTMTEKIKAEYRERCGCCWLLYAQYVSLYGYGCAGAIAHSTHVPVVSVCVLAESWHESP